MPKTWCHHVGDIGKTIFCETCEVDPVNPRWIYSIIVTRPDRTSVELPASGVVEDDKNYLIHTITDPFITPGVYKKQGKVISGNNIYHGPVTSFKVSANL